VKDAARLLKTAPKPIFVAKLDDQKDMADLKDICGAEAVKKAFGEDGGGIAEILVKAMLAKERQIERKRNVGDYE
jgi:hypothetical protein